jgi:hypothetical protein
MAHRAVESVIVDAEDEPAQEVGIDLIDQDGLET